ncbi:hypothetical protein [uncultured Pseudodesulfovibrio sp.]|uniref:hypothetical protein n=1 Tax=uncultured Pseudodesulfovibrio sp. TaxID=2035858 RepID=UPI0029C717F0|nr:hypothetical protein [uncultured Pseudodesulfovibrio sp.]
MSFWKIAAGAALGVGAIAAAPFTGGGSVLAAASLAGSLAGAGTVAAAAGAATVGAAAGAALASSENEKQEERINRLKAEHELEKKKLSEQLTGIMNDTTKAYEFVIAMHAVGVATAYADGNISDEEKLELDEVVAGYMNSWLPDSLKSQIKDITDNPPSVRTAYQFVEKLDLTQKGWKQVDELIEMVIMADDYEDEKETAFREAWKVLRKAA